MRTKYQYCLYGVGGEFRGITTRLTEAKAHNARVQGIYYYRRYEYDPNDCDWVNAARHGLTCDDQYKERIES